MNKRNQMQDFVVTVTGPDGTTKDYKEECEIPFQGKTFAVLVRIPGEDGKISELETVLARMEQQEDGSVSYVSPTDEEFEAVSAIYDAM